MNARGGVGAPMTPVFARVVETRRETEDVVTLGLDLEGFRFAPGQFNMLYAFGIGEVPISISGDPGAAGPLVHTVRDVGAATRAICAVQPGESLGLRGPYGSSWPVAEAEGGDLLIVAGGLGLAPLRPAIYAALEAPERFRRFHLLYGGREPAQLLFREEVERWRGEDAIEVALTVDAAIGEWREAVGVVPDLIRDAEIDPQTTTAMLCGPEVMMRFSARALLARGVPAERIHVSLERNMKCAVTHCGRCQFATTFACREGAVYRWAAVEPLLGVREL